MYSSDISVILICYNSDETVEETLNSIKNQSFDLKRIELIIADDLSTDNTVRVVEKWLGKHSSLFGRVNFIVNKENLGVSKNLSNAYELATSQWIKPIAGDDMLTKNCLIENFNYVIANKDCHFLFSYAECFYSNSEFESFVSPSPVVREMFDLNAKQQCEILRKANFPVAPTLFFNKVALDNVGGIDLRFRNVEDYPLWYKVTKFGLKLHFVDRITVRYRIGESLSQTDDFLIPLGIYQVWYDIQNRLFKPDVPFYRLDLKVQYLFYPRMILWLVNIFDNKKSRLSSFLLNTLRIFRPPFFLRFKFLLKSYCKRLK